MVIVTGTATEDEMIASFLRGELNSPRFGDRLKRALVAQNAMPDLIFADTTDEVANRMRRDVLVAYRGWGRYESLFGGLPAEDVEWMWVELEEEDLRDRVFTISYYFEETLGTRRLVEIAEMKRRNDPGSPTPILDDVRAGPLPEPPILMGDAELHRLVILEGHSRMISYLVDPSAVPFPIRAMVGVSSRISEWSEW